ncbi:MAG: 8-oxoguanine deaminase [Sphaerochaetaceae bacterium]|jgi:8-oxoguanine deaminase|nr:8-oxoguanine deaminase [Sphaerochaetaceae bacterium]
MTVLFKNIYCLMTEPGVTKTGVDLLAKDGKVAFIGSYEGQADRVIDCSKLVVIPGLVNTHHHFYQTLTRNLPAVQDAKLFDWLVYLYEIWKNIDPESVYWSSMLAMGELLKTGCTLTTDHHYLYPRGFSADLMGLQFKAADELGMRFSPTRGSMTLSRKDGGLPPDSVVQSEEEVLEDSERCIQAYHDGSDFSMHKIVLAPCSPFSVTKSTMLKSARLARRYGVKLHTHLCETIDEEDQCLAMYGVRPVQLMEDCEFIGEDVFYAHGIWFNDQELDILARNKATIAHCPASNMRLGSGICRVKEALERGINVSLAVDGSASNDSSDMLGELRLALLLQRVKHGSGALKAKDVLAMGTVNGARALGYSKVGMLKEGWAADLAAFDVSKLAYSGSQSDPLAAILFCGYDHQSRYTMVNGRLVVDEGRLVGIDEDLLARRANEQAERLYRKGGIL